MSFKDNFIKDIISFFVQFISYPFIVWIFCEMLFETFINFYFNKNNLFLIYRNTLFLIKKRILTLFGIAINIILFMPFNSGYRYGPDLRGFYTMFSLQDLNNNSDYFAILFSIIIYSFGLFGAYIVIRKIVEYFYNQKNYSSEKKIMRKQLSSYVNLKLITKCLFFLLLFFILVIARKLTFTTTRHSLFIIPPILIIFSFGAKEFLKIIKKNFSIKTNQIFSFLLISFVPFILLISTNESIKRVDVLKSNNLPDSIINFVKNSKDLKYTILGCSPHYKYANFDRKKLHYDRKEAHNITDLYVPGEKLIISQRPIYSKTPGEFNNEFFRYLFFSNPQKGDAIDIFDKKVRIIIKEKPFIKKTSIYYDSLNESSRIFNLFHFFRKIKTYYINNLKTGSKTINDSNNKIIYDWYDFYSKATGEEYRYSRPNDIWLIPVKVEIL